MHASGGALVLLSGQPTPQPDGCNTIRCRCRAQCRRRCPVGRLRACMACSTSVGPCCGFLAIDDSLGAACPLREFVVCHVCFFGASRAPCAWSPPVADFPHMNAQQARVWHQLRRDFVLQAVLNDHRSQMAHADNPSSFSVPGFASAAGCTAGCMNSSEETRAWMTKTHGPYSVLGTSPPGSASAAESPPRHPSVPQGHPRRGYAGGGGYERYAGDEGQDRRAGALA